MPSVSWPNWLATAPAAVDEEHKMRLLEGEDDQASEERGDEEQVKSSQSPFVIRIQYYAAYALRKVQKHNWLRKKQERKLHPTSYLDGLRGVASFFVFIHHSSLALFPEIRPGYGAAPLRQGVINHNYFIQLPFVRLVYSGSAMVDIFFVISGAVLTLKPLRLTRDGEHLELIKNLSSSAFRRGPRLFIPCFVSTFVTAFASISGWMLQSGISRNYPLSPSHSWYEQFSRWFLDMLQFVRPNAIGTAWEQNLWTIPIEFRGSMMVFLCSLGVARLRSRWMRTLSLVLLNCYWLYLGWWEFFLFLSGMLVSEFSLYRNEDPKHSITMRGVHLAMLVLATYLLSMPEKGENLAGSAFGYGWLHSNYSLASWMGNVEPGRFWPCFGAALFVAVQTHAGPDSYVQRFFTTSFIQYLGEISFSFYLWHGLIIYTVGARVMTYAMATIGVEGLRWWASLLLTEVAMLPTLFLISHVSTQYVDRAAVRFGKWLMEL